MAVSSEVNLMDPRLQLCPRHLVALANEAEEAEKALLTAIEEAYPAGTLVRARTSRGFLYGRIVGWDWQRRVRFQNESSGKISKHSYRDVEILSKTDLTGGSPC